MAVTHMAEQGLTHLFTQVDAPVHALTPPEYQAGAGVALFGLFALLLRV